MAAQPKIDLEEQQPVSMDPLAFFPPPDPAAAAFTIDQVWPRQGPTGVAPAPAAEPAWLSQFAKPARD